MVLIVKAVKPNRIEFHLLLMLLGVTDVTELVVEPVVVVVVGVVGMMTWMVEMMTWTVEFWNGVDDFDLYLDSASVSVCCVGCELKNGFVRCSGRKGGVGFFV
jgi:hypothetical protein